MKKLYSDLLYMLSCSVNDITPEKDIVQDIDLEQLYHLSQFHSVRGLVCIALENVGIENKSFDQSYYPNGN